MAQFEEKEAVKVASMYYEEGMTQAAIAKKMGVSRSLISKILIDAKKDGIVEIYIRSNNTYTVNLERAIEKKYDLKEAIVVDTFSIKDQEIEKRVAQEATNYLIKATKNIHKLGISWGKSLRTLIDYYPHTNQNDIVIYPLIGGMGDDYVDIHSNQLSYDLARRMRAKAKYLYAPALMSNNRIKEELLNNATINNVIEESKTVDLAIVGIASPYIDNTMSEIGYLNEEHVQEFKELGVVGDMNSHFFDATGQEVEHEINRNVIGLSLEDLSKIPNVMSIAYNIDKIDAIHVALTAGLINIIAITDKMAERLLEMD